MTDLRLSEHFLLSEFEWSATATIHGIDNRAPEACIGALRQLCQHVLEPLRQFAANPVLISSGYRCPLLNRLLGGRPNSQHLLGQAADICLPSVEEGHRWYNWLMDNCDFDQLIWEHAGNSRWIHVSYRDPSHNRGQVFRQMHRSA